MEMKTLGPPEPVRCVTSRLWKMIGKESKQMDPFEIARALTRSIKATQLYPVDHPRVENHLQEFLEHLEGFHEQQDQFVMGVDNQKLLVQHAPAENDEILNKQLFPVLESMKVGSLMFEPGVTKEELTRLLEILSSDREGDDADGEPLGDGSSFDHIRINKLEVQYDVSMEDVPEMAETMEETEEMSPESDDTFEEVEGENDFESAFEAMKKELLSLLTDEPDPEEIDELVEQMMSAVDASQYSVDKKLQVIVELMNMMFEEARAGDREICRETFQQFFVQMFLDMSSEGPDPFSKMMEQAEEGMNVMDADAKDFLFEGEDADNQSFSTLFQQVRPEDRGRVIADEIRAGTPSVHKLTETIETIAPGGNDLVEITSSAVQEMSHFVDADKQEPASELSSLFNALLAKTPYKKPPVKVLIIDDDDTYYRYLTHLSEKLYFFDLYTNGQKAWDETSASEELDYDLVILEIKIPGKNGLEILQHLNNQFDSPPVIICTRYPEFRDAYEIATYPEIRFIEKPVDEGEFQEAVQEFVMLGEGGGLETKDQEVSAEDLERAKGIQKKLFSTEGPDLAGCELSIRHQSSEVIGGDYLDIIPLDQQEYLMVFANVAGTGVSASMVMVILRSILHVLSGQTSDPRELMLKANRIIADGIDRPMFVRMILGKYSTQNQTLQVLNAGNNNPLFWNQAAGTVSFVDLSGLALGLTGSRRFEDVLETRNVSLNSGDAVLFCSDGVVQCRNEEGDTFGSELCFSTIEKYGHGNADELTEQIMREVESFASGPRELDRTVLALKSRL